MFSCICLLGVSVFMNPEYQSRIFKHPVFNVFSMTLDFFVEITLKLENGSSCTFLSWCT